MYAAFRLIIMQWIVSGLLLGTAMTAYADTSAGLQWLSEQLDPEQGHYQTAQTITYPYHASSEVLTTLQLLGEPLPDTAINYLTAPGTFPSTEHYARQLLLAYNNDIATELLSRINGDHGVGDLADYASDPLSTAFLLEAFAQPQVLDDDAVINTLAPVIGYLTNTAQHPDGGWGLNSNSDASPYSTAVVMHALWHYRHAVSNRPTLNLDSSIAAASNYLNQQLATGLPSFETALSLIALLPTLSEIDAQTTTHIETLRQAQQAEGSWDDDVYTTALALRALHYADTPLGPNPDLGGITGQILDEETGTPLTGVTIYVMGGEHSVETDGQGIFELTDLPFGEYSLRVGEGDHLIIDTQIKQASVTDLGEIKFFPIGDATVVKGTILDHKGNPIPDVLVTLTGSPYTMTDANGNYFIGEVDASDASSSLTFEARKETYITHTTTLDITSGQTMIYSPALPRNAITLSGITYDAENDTPLADVTISVRDGAYSTITGPEGAYEINNIVGGGVLEVEASKAGYQVSSISMEIPIPAVDMFVEYSPRLQGVETESDLPARLTSGIQGIVVAGTGRFRQRQALVYVNDEFYASTDGGGYFKIINRLPVGEMTVKFTPPYYSNFYDSTELNVTLAENMILDLGEVLLPLKDSQKEGVKFTGVKGIVKDLYSDRTDDENVIGIVEATLTLGDKSLEFNSRYDMQTAERFNGKFEVTDRNLRVEEKFDELTGTLHIYSSGYAERSFNLSLVQNEILDMGVIFLRPNNAHTLAPDIIPQHISMQTLHVDPFSLELNGQLAVNLGNYGRINSPNPFEVLAFYDADFNNVYESHVDIVLGTSMMTGALAAEAANTETLNLDLQGQVPLQNPIIKVWADSSQTVVESYEDNNFNVFNQCEEKTTVDVAICIDASPSLYWEQHKLNIKTIADAIQNPNVIAHDSSVRLSLFHFHWRINTLVPPTFINSGNANVISDELRLLNPFEYVDLYTEVNLCIEAATEMMMSAEPATDQQVIYLITDGWFDRGVYNATKAAVENAKLAGIDVLNAFSVGIDNSGSIAPNPEYHALLERDVVFPKGDDKNGIVIGMTDYENFVDNVFNEFSGKYHNVYQPDYSLAQLQLVHSPDNNPALTVRVGNGGTPNWDADLTVSFFAGTPSEATLFATVPLAQPSNQAYQDITLPVTELSQPHDIHAVVDWQNQIAECNETNNTIATDFSSLIGTLQVSTGALSYPPQTTADLYYRVANQGIFMSEHTPTADYQVQLQILSLTEEVVVELPKFNITALEGGTSTPLTDLDWNTGNLLAGHYTFRGNLYNATGELIDTDTSRFEITAGDLPYANLRTSTDKPVYHTTDAVNISHLVQNLTHNKIIRDGLLTVSIQAPDGQTLHTQTLALNDVPPQGQVQPLTPFMLEAALTGNYTILTHFSDDSGELASAQTEFTVQNQLALAVSGQVEVAWNNPQSPVCVETITNAGATPLDNLAVRHMLINLDTQDTLESLETQTSLQPAAQQQWSMAPSSALGVANYACVLQAKWAEDWETLDFAQFSLSDFVAVECQHVYGVHDDQFEDSQLFTYHIDTQTISPLGLPYPGYDLEGLDIHPYTQTLYASSGKTQGSRLYEVNAFNGDLRPVGDIGFNKVESLSFHPDGSLWGWSAAGLIEIDLSTGQGTLTYPVGDLPHMEGLTWDSQGEVLYATHASGGQSRVYRYDGSAFTEHCASLKGGVESLESHPAGTLIFASHQVNDVNLHSLEADSCTVLADAAINATFNDIEGIAWPQNNCSTQQLALRAFFNAFADEAVFIGEDNQVRVELAGEIHLGRLADSLTAGTPPANGQLQLVAIPDANGDGQDDYLITYPDGQQQVLFYLGVDSP